MNLPLETNLFGVYIISGNTESKKLLLLKRSSKCPYAPLTWQILYGHLEDGENIIDAIFREIEEETGMRRLSIYSTNEILSFFKKNSGTLIFAPAYMAIADWDSTIKLNQEHVDYRWVSLDNAEDYLIWNGQRRILRVIKDLLSGDGKEALNLLKVNYQ